MHRIITRDPVGGGELIVTRLEAPESGIVIEGQFSLGWIGRLNSEQLEFVELMVKNRGNINGVAGDLRIAYNTARSRLDDIVTALGYVAPQEDNGRVDRRWVEDEMVWSVKTGLMDRVLPVEQLVDDTYVDYALQLLGPYRPPTP